MSFKYIPDLQIVNVTVHSKKGATPPAKSQPGSSRTFCNEWIESSLYDFIEVPDVPESTW